MFLNVLLAARRSFAILVQCQGLACLPAARRSFACFALICLLQGGPAEAVVLGWYLANLHVDLLAAGWTCGGSSSGLAPRQLAC